MLFRRAGRALIWVVVLIAVVAIAAVAVNNIYRTRRSHGAGTGTAPTTRTTNPGDVAVPSGYRVDVVASGLTFPAAVAFDDSAHLFVIEAGYVYGEKWTTPRLLRIDEGGRATEIARGDRPPWNGISYANGAFLIAEGGARDGGRIIRVSRDGSITVLADSLPGMGDHHVNRPVLGPDGKIYFGNGTATNSGVVGLDNNEFGWLKRHPDFHDIPCRDLQLGGQNFDTTNPLAKDSATRVTTGAYLPFGTPSTRGQVVRGSLPCTGSVMRIPAAGGRPELVAWGFRNPFGLALAPDGAFYVTENGFDIRGSRPVFGAADHLFRLVNGGWYGWPDYAGGLPLADERFKPEGRPQPRSLLAATPARPERPVARLAVHSSSNGFDFSRNASFGHVGEAFIAQFGDMTPNTGKAWYPIGARVVRVDVTTGAVTDFMTNRGKIHGPASWQGSAGIERPVDARFDPSGTALYITDFGVMTMTDKGPDARPGTGVVWRITRGGGAP
jgi:glucose/arabinose dehydrogenase